MDPREFQYVGFGLAAAWLILLGYLVLMAVRERKLRRELDRVRQMVEQTGRKA